MEYFWPAVVFLGIMAAFLAVYVTAFCLLSHAVTAIPGLGMAILVGFIVLWGMSMFELSPRPGCSGEVGHTGLVCD
jgi:hypothetical protein